MSNSALLEQVKRKCNITWSDVETDGRVNDIIANAEPIMRHKLGITDTAFDFSTPSAENSLFVTYCLYEYNNVAHEFDAAYWNDIAQTRARYEVEQWSDDDDET